MNIKDAKRLLSFLKELAKTNVIIDTFLREAVIEVRADFYPSIPSEEYIDEVIVDKYLANVVQTIIKFQNQMLENEMLEVEFNNK